MKRSSDVAPLGLREQREKVNVTPSASECASIIAAATAGEPEPPRPRRGRSSPASSCIQGFSGRTRGPSAAGGRRTNTPASAAKAQQSSGLGPWGLGRRGSAVRQTDRHAGKRHRVFEVGLVMVNVGETRVQRTVQHHLEGSRSSSVSSTLSLDNLPPSVLLTNPLKTEKAAAASRSSDRSRSTGRDRRLLFCSAAI